MIVNVQVILLHINWWQGGEQRKSSAELMTGPGSGVGGAHLWHGADFVHLADELTVGLKKQQQLEV